MNIKDLNKDNRLLESQQLLRDAMHEAIGIYMAKEPSEKDAWRDNTLWNLWQHFKHEVQEIETSDTKDRAYHNCLDGINLLAMMAVRIREYKKE